MTATYFSTFTSRFEDRSSNLGASTIGSLHSLNLCSSNITELHNITSNVQRKNILHTKLGSVGRNFCSLCITANLYYSLVFFSKNKNLTKLGNVARIFTSLCIIAYGTSLCAKKKVSPYITRFCMKNIFLFVHC